MATANLVAENMKNIQCIFQEVQAWNISDFTLPELMAKLDTYESNFRSIAYESASMNFALIDLQKGLQLTTWNTFLQQAGTLHTTQIYIGLGWALAKNQLDPTFFLPNITPYLRYRILDGYGYYEGIFRKRKSIINQEQPSLNNATAHSAYNQGLGRSMWYLSEGNIDMVKSMMEKFPANLQPDFWRGLGIAITYVGDCEPSYLQQIYIAAETYAPQLKAGAAMAIISRFNANFISPSTYITCTELLSKTVPEVIALNEEIKAKLDATSEDVYAEWLVQLEHNV